MPKPELRNGIQMDDECQATEEMLSNGTTPTESHQSEDEDKNQGLPIDRGWAWVVLGGTFELESNAIGESKSILAALRNCPFCWAKL